MFPKSCAGCSGHTSDELAIYEKKCNSGICGYYKALQWDSQKDRHCIFQEGFCSLDLSMHTCSNLTYSKAFLNSGTIITEYCCNNGANCNTEMAPHKKSYCPICSVGWITLLLIGFILFCTGLAVASCVVCTNKRRRRRARSDISRAQRQVRPRPRSRRRRVPKSRSLGRNHPRFTARRRRATASRSSSGRLRSAGSSIVDSFRSSIAGSSGRRRADTSPTLDSARSTSRSRRRHASKSRSLGRNNTRSRRRRSPTRRRAASSPTLGRAQSAARTESDIAVAMAIEAPEVQNREIPTALLADSAEARPEATVTFM